MLKENDLWANIGGNPNLLIVGSLLLNGNKYPTSNFGKSVGLFAQGEKIEVFSPLPDFPGGYKTEVRGTSFSAPLVAAAAANLIDRHKNKNLKVDVLKGLLIKKYSKERKELVLKEYAKACKTTFRVECIYSLITMMRNPILWADLHNFYLRGKKKWGYSPLPIEYTDKIKSLGKTQLVSFKGKFIPAISVNKHDNSYELLMTLNHDSC